MHITYNSVRERDSDNDNEAVRHSDSDSEAARRVTLELVHSPAL